MPRLAFLSAAVLSAVLAVAGCSSGPTAGPVPETPPVASTSAAPTTAPEPSSPAPTVPAELKVGATFPYSSPSGEKMTVRVIAHKTTGDAEAVDVRLCNAGTVAFSASRGPWVLLYDGGESEHDEDIAGGGLPAPAYPDSFEPRDLSAGKCVRGWINWTPVAGKKPFGVAYQPDELRVVWKF